MLAKPPLLPTAASTATPTHRTVRKFSRSKVMGVPGKTSCSQGGQLHSQVPCRLLQQFRLELVRGRNTFSVQIDGVTVGTFTPGSNEHFDAFQTNGFAVAAGVHRVSFVGLKDSGGDFVSFVDNVSITRNAAALQVTLSTDSGAFTLAHTDGLTFVGGDGVNDSSMTFIGSADDINSALDGLQFMPAADFHGTANLTITTDNLARAVSGGEQTTPRASPSTFRLRRDTRDCWPPTTTTRSCRGRASSASTRRSTSIGATKARPPQESPGTIGRPPGRDSSRSRRRGNTRSMSPPTTASVFRLVTRLSTNGLTIGTSAEPTRSRLHCSRIVRDPHGLFPGLQW